MIPFSEISALPRAFFALWGLLLCLINIACGLLALVNKRYHYSALALVLLAPAYFLWQVAFDLSLFIKNGYITHVTEVVCNMNWVYWLLIFIGITICSVVLLVFNIRYDSSHISPSAIKLYLDKIPCGVCCFLDNGRVLFSNICMNDLCLALTNTPLQNGNVFKEAVKDGILIVQDNVWRFVQRDIISSGETLHEIVASNITTEYAKTQALEKDKAALSKLNEELRNYYLSIDETVRREEILQAKINIHDEMNKLMLTTMAVEGDNEVELNNIFSLWEKNALLMCMEAERNEDTKYINRIEKLAEALKIKINWDKNVEKIKKENLDLFYLTFQEAIINAVKHAEAKTMNVTIKEEKNDIICSFINDGTLPFGNITFAGGLNNLSRIAKERDAKLDVIYNKQFTLNLTLKK